MKVEATVREIEELYDRFGGERYGEGITQLEHALQCAALAIAEQAPDSLVAAALLHDIGHLIEESDDAFGTIAHDRSGGDYLAARFGAAVSEPVRLHVAAKRYLVAVEPAYADRLSPASTYTLARQGGAMNVAEVAAFAANPWAKDAVKLRRWDDAGKVEGQEVPDFAAYRPLLRSFVVS